LFHFFVMDACMSSSPVYKVIFLNHEQIIELYARSIFQSDLEGFVEIEEFFLKGNNADKEDGESKLQEEFKGVKRSYLPMHNIIRIDEVERQGNTKGETVADSQNKVMKFPARGTVVSSPEPKE